jgi:hypothetical protein
MAIVGISGWGSDGRKNSRRSRMEPRISQLMTPVPNAPSATSCKPTGTAQAAPTSGPATVGRKYPGWFASSSIFVMIHWPVMQPPSTTVSTRKMITRSRAAA